MTTIAIMNAKGGVGKSTLTMALAETLAVFHRKRVLMIDADGQMSLSVMVMPVGQLNELRAAGRSLVGWLGDQILGPATMDWRGAIAGGASDVDDARSIFILAGDMDLTLIEREATARNLMHKMRASCHRLLAEARHHFDVVLVDCAPGISVMTECWLRECDWHLVPMKPDILAAGGVEYLTRFRRRDPQLGFARHLGIVINMKQMQSETDVMIHDLLRERPDLACFEAAIPMLPHIQKAAMFSKDGRSYLNKYPAAAGAAMKSLANELLQRTGEANRGAA